MAMQKLLLLFITVNIMACVSYADHQRYRGSYTLGHEVNTFCPEINSQCYWLSADTGKQVRSRLEHIYREKTAGLYKPVCVLIEGEIDRNSVRTGFAADMDGLINISRVHGDCESTTMVTQGDLQHHRWVLVSLNEQHVDADDWPLLPVLDFGERMFVEGSDGCRQFSGFAALSGDKIIFDALDFINSSCKEGRTSTGRLLIAGTWRIRVDRPNYLVLQQKGLKLTYKLDDWR